MIYLVLGLVAFVLFALAARSFVDADPRKVAKALRKGGAFALMGIGAVFGITGRWAIAIPIFVLGFSLLGVANPLAGSGRASRSAGTGSRVRSRYLEMRLDHDTGDMDGDVLAGRRAGSNLSQLSVEDLVELRHEVEDDPDSAALLEAYLDRRTPGWREDFQGDPAGGGGFSGAGPMTEQEAHEILGLEPGAGEQDIRRAHRTLMKKMHPDQGGSTYLATRVNAAKDLLLRKHGRAS